MIIRKPYAFLIKNFKKIHTVLLILSLYLAYRIFDVNRFVNEFMRLGTYDLYSDPISHHITFIMNIAIIIMIVGSGALVLLLRHKNKPWKVYLLPLINYIALFFVLSIIKNFFKTYTMSVEVTDLRFSRDLLFAFIAVQFPVIGIFFVRTIGLDINKFNFNMDQEFLELSDEDREEIEISLDIDVNTFKRLYRKVLRNINYFYQEHKLISRIIIGIISLVFLFNIYTFLFVTNKSYKETDNYNYNDFTIKVDNSYVTDKDYKGSVISKKSKFVIVNISLTNNTDSSKKFDTSRFHLKAANLDFTTTETTYAKEFYDLGKTYSKVSEVNGGNTVNFIIIYKVDSSIKNDKFVLFFQEKDSNNILRKIKLNIKDLSKIEDLKEYKVGDSIHFDVANKEDDVSIDSYQLATGFDYSMKKCKISDCSSQLANYQVPDGEKVLILDFASNIWESDDIVDFLDKCVMVEYTDEEGIDREIDVKFALNNKYLGKIAYVLVPNEVEKSEKLKLHFIFRNKEYNYVLK